MGMNSEKNSCNVETTGVRMVDKTTMARAVRFTSIVRRGEAEPCGLEAAPSSRDWEEISAGLEGVEPIDFYGKLLEGTHEIRGSYRGWTMWLYPNVRFNRNEPKTTGGNGFAGSPSVGMEEKVMLNMKGVIYDAEVEFV